MEISPAPYTVVLRNTATSPTGAALETSDITVAVRGDGTRLILTQGLSGPRSSFRTISFASGETVLADDVREAKSTTWNPTLKPRQWLRDPASRCVNDLAGKPFLDGERFVSTEVLAGFSAVKIEVRGVTAWFVPSQGCAQIQTRFLWDKGAHSTQRLIALLPGEPQRELFEVPAGYRELPPSSYHALSSDQATSAERKALLARQDQWYEAHRPPGQQ